MLNNLPRQSPTVFGNGPINSMTTTLLKARKRLARQFDNPRLLRISFHTFRHWKATMLYHKIHDVIAVKQFLGHRELRNTELYINLEKRIFNDSSDDEFTIKAVKTVREAMELGAIGFEPFLIIEGMQLMRKRK